jgi:hypothetical protein
VIILSVEEAFKVQCQEYKLCGENTAELEKESLEDFQ